MANALMMMVVLCIMMVVFGICKILLVILRQSRRNSARFMGSAELDILLTDFKYKGKDADAIKAAENRKTDAEKDMEPQGEKPLKAKPVLVSPDSAEVPQKAFRPRLHRRARKRPGWSSARKPKAEKEKP